MTQAPLWLGDLTGQARDHAIDELAATLMMLVGLAPQGGPDLPIDAGSVD